MDSPGTTAVSLIAEDTIVSMRSSAHSKRTSRRVGFVVLLLFLVSMWLGSVVYRNGKRGTKDTILSGDETMIEAAKDGVEDNADWDYKEGENEDYGDDEGDDYGDDEDDDYDDGERDEYEDEEGEEFEEEEENEEDYGEENEEEYGDEDEEEYREEDEEEYGEEDEEEYEDEEKEDEEDYAEDDEEEYEEDEDAEYEEDEEEEYEDDDDDEEEEEEEEEYEEEDEEEEGGDQSVDLNRIEAALMEEDDNIIDTASQRSESQDIPADVQQSHKVSRSVVQEVDFSILEGDKDWAKENPFPKIRFDLRQKLMEERCQSADTSKESLGIIKTNKIGIFFKQKASACLVNKSGSTTWRAHLKRVNEAGSIYQQIDKRWKAFMSQPNLSKAMAETSRIITVRHPLTRLVSAYRQRFNNGKPVSLNVWNKRMKHVKKYFSNYWLPAIISNNVIPAEERTRLGVPHRHRVGKIYSVALLKKVHQRLGSGFSITFPMFLRHVMYTHKHNIVDNHWKPIDWLCSPCLLHYEHIVKLETMTEDVKHVFNELKIPSNAEMRKNKESYGHDPWGDLKRYEDVPLDLKRGIISLYWNDFYLFGYKLPPGFLDQ